MKIKLSLIMILVCVLSMRVMASEASEKMYLLQMINQLEAVKPLIIAAQNAQIKDARILFHYTSYHDAEGIKHNGLLEDINEIKKGIQEKLNQTAPEPRHFQAIKGDYLDLKPIKSTSYHYP